MASDARNKGDAACATNQFFDAVRYFTKAIDLSPKNHLLYYKRSVAYAYLHEYHSALDDARKVIELKPDFPKGYILLGAAYLGLGFNMEAIDTYTKGLDIEPNNQALKAGLANACNAESVTRHGPALFGKNFERVAVSGMEREAEAQKGKLEGKRAFKRKDYETAIRCYSKAIELDYEDVFCHTGRAAAYFELGKYDECIKDCDEAVKRGRELHSNSKIIANTLTRKGTALIKLAKCLKDYNPAIDTFQEALTEHHTTYTLKELNYAEWAKEELEQKKCLNLKRANEEQEKGNVFIKGSKYPEAVKWHNEALKRNQKDLKCHLVDIKKGKNVIRVKESSDDDDDCVEIDPLELTCKVKLDDMDPATDVVAVAWKGSVALRDFSHPRHLCGNFPFNSTAHESYCSKCFCFVCEIAAPCLHWKGTKGHCNMSTEAEKLEAISFFSKHGNHSRSERGVIF